MTTFQDLIVTAEVAVEQAQKRKDKALAEIKFFYEQAKREGRVGLNADEDEEVAKSQLSLERAKEDLEKAERSLEQLQRVKAAEAAADEKLNERTDGAEKPKYDRAARVGAEERTYHKGNDKFGSQFIRDVTAHFMYNDPEAAQRLGRHIQEERVERGKYMQRAAGTGAFAGLTVPQYLTELYAPATANMRPFADACNRQPLPDRGMTINISRITTATSAAAQASENSAVSETNIDDTLLTENVLTVAGQQTLSRQAIERGTGIESVVLNDLFRRYASALDSKLINDATTGLTNVAQDTNYTDASPTGSELYKKILQAASQGEATYLGLAHPDVVVMHSRRWYWLQSELTSTWPLISQPYMDPQAGGVNYGVRYGSGYRGRLPNGMVVVVDNNVPTTLGGGTEDEIYVVSSDECWLWEDAQAPVFIRAEQPSAASLGVLLVVYGYFAYSFRRYTNGAQKISDTGLIAPTF